MFFCMMHLWIFFYIVAISNHTKHQCIFFVHLDMNVRSSAKHSQLVHNKIMIFDVNGWLTHLWNYRKLMSCGKLVMECWCCCGWWDLRHQAKGNTWESNRKEKGRCFLIIQSGRVNISLHTDYRSKQFLNYILTIFVIRIFTTTARVQMTVMVSCLQSFLINLIFSCSSRRKL